jgi:hypothetical protein
MTAQEKKNLIQKKMEGGDKRSYNEIAADLELEIWTERHKGQEWMKQKFGKR